MRRSAVFSPRPWGCVSDPLGLNDINRVFPTPVGVCRSAIPRCCSRESFPHARGGVSPPNPAALPDLVFSPRPWGCVVATPASSTMDGVFPTPVGVCRAPPTCAAPGGRSPHARGGVSRVRRHVYTQAEFSPRPWGCVDPETYSVTHRGGGCWLQRVQTGYTLLRRLASRQKSVSTGWFFVLLDTCVKG